MYRYKYRRNIIADSWEVARLFPKIANYSFIPIDTEIGQLRSGARLFFVGGKKWSIKANTVEDVEAGIKEFLYKARKGGARPEDRRDPYTP